MLHNLSSLAAAHLIVLSPIMTDSDVFHKFVYQVFISEKLAFNLAWKISCAFSSSVYSHSFALSIYATPASDLLFHRVEEKRIMTIKGV